MGRVCGLLFSWALDGSGGSWSYHEITTTADGSHWVFGIDVDGDDDVDVLSASWLDGTQPDSSQPNSTWLDGSQLDSSQLDSTQPDSTQLASSRLGGTQLNDSQLDSLQPDS